MKHQIKAIVIFIILSITYNLSSQTVCKDAQLTIDFAKLYDESKPIPTYSSSIFQDCNCYLEKGETYSLKIVNINLNVFKVQEGFSSQDFNTEKPEIFKQFKLPAFLNLSEPDYMSQTNGLAYSSPKDPFKELVKHLEKTYWQIKTLEPINQMLEYYKNNCSDTLADIMTKINSDFKNIRHNSTQNSIEDYLNIEVLQNIKKSIDLAIIFEDLFTKHQKEIMDAADIQIAALNKELAKLTKIKKPSYPQGVRIRNIRAELKSLDEQKEKPDTYKVRVKEFLSAIKGGSLYETIYEILNKRGTFITSNYTYIYPFKAEKDLTKIELTISTDKDLACKKPKKLILKKEYWTNKGLKIDFSAGAMVNFGNRGFIGEEFENFEVDDTMSTIRAKDGGSRALLSIGAFMHIYQRSHKNLKIAFSPGISTNDDFDGLVYHLGASLLIGRKDRLILTTGLSAKSSSILDNNYRLGEEYETSSLPESPSTVNFFPKFGYFFSLSYNLSSKKAD